MPLDSLEAGVFTISHGLALYSTILLRSTSLLLSPALPTLWSAALVHCVQSFRSELASHYAELKGFMDNGGEKSPCQIKGRGMIQAIIT
jgi:hypothetical protein